MHQIRISSIKNPNIYRIVQVPDNMTLFDFESIISTAFSIENEDEVYFETVRVNDEKRNEIISVYEDDFNQFDSLEETVGNWFQRLTMKCIT